MNEFLVKPRFSALRNALYFDTDSLNAFARAEYNEHFGFYQQTFGVYAYMRMTSLLKYVIHYPQQVPFLWQAHNSCAWTPTGTLSMATKEIEPCRAKIQEQFCYDEWLDSAYKSWLDWSSNQVQMNAAGVQATNELVQSMVANATVGARAVNVAGQLYDTSALTFEEGTPTRVRDAFIKSADSCKGWIPLVRELAAAGLDHLETGAIVGGDISADGKTYTGSALDLYDTMLAGAPQKLQQAINTGGVTGFGSVYNPLWLVSPSIITAVAADWRAQKSTTAVNTPRIERREYQVNTPGGSRPHYVYFIDDTAVVPVNEVGMFDQYLVETSHFAYLTISGAIQMGGSFADIPRLDGQRVGIITQVSDQVEDLGTHKFLSHALFATAINDTDFISGDYAVGTPA